VLACLQVQIEVGVGPDLRTAAAIVRSVGYTRGEPDSRAAGTCARRGRQQVYRVNADAVADALAPWLAKYEPYWSAALDRLGDAAEGR
jgi:hypothetical protein